MEDQEFLDRIRTKIERLTGTPVQLRLDPADESQLKVELDGPEPEIILGSNVLKYAGFARMAIEYAVASIRERRELGSLEFHALLARN